MFRLGWFVAGVALGAMGSSLVKRGDSEERDSAEQKGREALKGLVAAYDDLAQRVAEVLHDSGARTVAVNVPAAAIRAVPMAARAKEAPAAATANRPAAAPERWPFGPSADWRSPELAGSSPYPAEQTEP